MEPPPLLFKGIERYKSGGDGMLDSLIRAALKECAEQYRFPAVLGTDVFAWMNQQRKDGL